MATKFGSVETPSADEYFRRESATVEPQHGSFARGLGSLARLISRDLGAAVAVTLALWTGFSVITAPGYTTMNQGIFYLIGGGIFVATAFTCKSHNH